MSGLTFAIHESVEAVADLEGTWRELHGECTYRSLYNGFDFFMASITAFTDSDIRLFVLSASDGQAVVAIFPFQRTLFNFHGLKFHLVEYAAQWEIDKPYPLIRRGCEDLAWSGLFRFLRANSRHWHRFDLMEVRDGLPATAELSRLFRLPRYWVRVKDDYRSPLVLLDQPWEARWQAHRKMRKKVSRMEKAFGVRMHFQIVNGRDNWLDWLNTYVDLESRSWKAGRVGIGKDGQTLSFYRELFARLAARGQLRFGVLSVDDEPVAVEVAYIEGRVVYFSHGTFDERYAGYSPGMVSTTLFLRHFHGGDFDEGDYLAGYAGYVVPWADRVLVSSKVAIHRISVPVLYTFAVKAIQRLLPSQRRKRARDKRAPNL